MKAPHLSVEVFPFNMPSIKLVAPIKIVNYTISYKTGRYNKYIHNKQSQYLFKGYLEMCYLTFKYYNVHLIKDVRIKSGSKWGQVVPPTLPHDNSYRRLLIIHSVLKNSDSIPYS